MAENRDFANGKAKDGKPKKTVQWSYIGAFVVSVKELAERVLNQPGTAQITADLGALVRRMDLVEQNTTITKKLLETPVDRSPYASATTGYRNTRLVGAGGCQAMPPPSAASFPSTFAAQNTQGSRIDLSTRNDRRVVVELDPTYIDHYRTLTPSALRGRVASHIHASTDPNIASLQVAAAKQLRSGDLAIYTQTVAEKEAFKVVATTYGVIAHGIPANSIRMDDQKQTIARIQAENYKIGDEKDIPISYVGWLCVPKRAAGSMVVEFTDAEQANVAVQTGLIWDSKYKKTELYDRACQIQEGMLYKRQSSYPAPANGPSPDLAQRPRRLSERPTELAEKRVEAAAADPKGLCKLAKWAKSRGTASQAFTPALQQPDGTSASGPEEKAELLHAASFPTPPEADLSDIESYEYPEPLQMPLIAEQELNNAVLQAPGSKALGPDGISTCILHLVLPHILPQLLPLCNQCLKSGIHLKAFKCSTTVALRKPNKGDCRLANAYRSVAFLNTLGESYGVSDGEENELDGRGLSTAAKNTSGRTEGGVKRARSINPHGGNSDTPVTSLLMLDVSGAFDNVSNQRLLPNLKKRHTPMELASWIESFLKGRTSTLRLPEYESEPFSIHTGIPQGSPLSPIFYLFYNADLLDMGSRSDLKATAVSWIDDVGFTVTGASAAANSQILRTLHTGAEAWASKHASVFAPAKYELIHFTNKPGDHDTSAELVLKTNRVSHSRTCRVLGVILDSQLDFETHIRHIEAKATTSLGGLAAIAGSTWGFGLKDLRRLYISVVPQILYCCSAWYVADQARGTVMRRQRTLQKLTAIQQRSPSTPSAPQLPFSSGAPPPAPC
ncbi:MAG: reverse transcriptase [Lasallia pustulata]|uniref:Reverse transcriptase n=1 Tax=Lasallia pustulata TaxID=136370 RepID=A0A5M8PIC3_9LECA|nr:MAG: reverse transcriptase [Lasallia pustulata]